MSYDSWKLAHEERSEERPEACPVCTGDESAAPCTEDCAALVRRCRREKQIERFYQSARNALHLARVYRAEGPDRRLVKAMEAVRVYRSAIRQLRGAA